MKPRRKIRSKNLLKYLIESGVLDKGEDVIREAKIDYRKQYKCNWRQNRKGLHRELRISLTLREYLSLKLRSVELEMNPTTYAKRVILDSLGTKPFIPRSAVLHKVLQELGKGINQSKFSHLHQAEHLLISYLKDAGS